MRQEILIGGKAGQGPNILSELVSKGLLAKGYYVFYSRDYQSLIRGGHNFNQVAFSNNPIYSNSSEINILVCLDEKTKVLHKPSLNKKGVILEGDKDNMFFAGNLFKILGLEFHVLENELRKLKNYDENIRNARAGWNNEKRVLKFEEGNNKPGSVFMNGNQAIAEGAMKSELEYYYAYPMTPATPVMFGLGQAQTLKEAKHKVIELENEIAVIIAAMGSSAVGAKAMIGTSGGGFDLMTEGLSMLGIAEIPLVIYLASRPGPSTGVATYSSQADLNVARFGGHGEFSRVIAVPGTPQEAMKQINEAFYLSQKYRIPCILLGDKHLAESKYDESEKPKLIESPVSIQVGERFNSYEVDRNNSMIATEDAKIIKKNFDRRMKIQKDIAKEIEQMETCKIYGNKNSKNLIVSWGSPTGAIIDALNEGGLVDAKFLQVLYIEPLSQKIINELKAAKKIIAIENSATSQISQVIAEKTGILTEEKNKILRYHGRPFFSDELAKEIKGRLK
jgi:2-oxoglutarate ferredoxin oxidoreductase subunit alpha